MADLPAEMEKELERHAAGYRDVFTQCAFDLGDHTDNMVAIGIIRDALSNYNWISDVYVWGEDRGNDTLAEIRFSFRIVGGGPVPAGEAL